MYEKSTIEEFTHKTGIMVESVGLIIKLINPKLIWSISQRCNRQPCIIGSEMSVHRKRSTDNIKFFVLRGQIKALDLKEHLYKFIFDLITNLTAVYKCHWKPLFKENYLLEKFKIKL